MGGERRKRRGERKGRSGRLIVNLEYIIFINILKNYVVCIDDDRARKRKGNPATKAYYACSVLTNPISSRPLNTTWGPPPAFSLGVCHEAALVE